MPDELAYRQKPCNIIIIGASGDLTRKKLLPALFSLYCNKLLPEQFSVFGFARSDLSHAQFRELAATHLTCRYTPEPHDCDRDMAAFLDRCFYHRGQYDDTEALKTLRLTIAEHGFPEANLLMYMAVPPNVFLDAARSLAEAGLVHCDACSHWSRIVVEKPFGRDRQSSAELLRALGGIFRDDQTYRIDHYLGKEVIQNLLILRFANLIFEPLWNRHHIRAVHVDWGETGGCEGRAGYFDHYGIIRDVVQNHLMQILALVAMEQPLSLAAEDVRDEKVKLLRAVRPLTAADVVVGQYTAANGHPGYLEEDGVPPGSITPTYARATLYVDTPRWFGVPFHISAGKGIDRQTTSIRIDLQDVPYSIFRDFEGRTANSLHIQVQPEEAIKLQITSKHPGMRLGVSPVSLDLLYRSTFRELIPEAYERLLFEVLRGDQSMFIRGDELAASWRVVDTALHELEAGNVPPRPYPFGSAGPQ